MHQVNGKDFKVEGGLHEDGDEYLDFIDVKPLELLFHRAEAPLPMHGFARKNVRKISQFKFYIKGK